MMYGGCRTALNELGRGTVALPVKSLNATNFRLQKCECAEGSSLPEAWGPGSELADLHVLLSQLSVEPS